MSRERGNNSCRSPTADQYGMPTTKVSTAPALAVREHGRRFFHVDPLWFLLVAPQAKSLFNVPVVRLFAIGE